MVFVFCLLVCVLQNVPGCLPFRLYIGTIKVHIHRVLDNTVMTTNGTLKELPIIKIGILTIKNYKTNYMSQMNYDTNFIMGRWIILCYLAAILWK